MGQRTSYSYSAAFHCSLSSVGLLRRQSCTAAASNLQKDISYVRRGRGSSVSVKLSWRNRLMKFQRRAFVGSGNFSVDENILSLSDVHNAPRISRLSRNYAQKAFFEYLYYTRSLHFSDAEHMSKNSPVFLQKLLKLLENEQDIGRSLARFFNYHPINEFEPFFESSGLKPAEFHPLLPRNLMFLSDDGMLLENYRVLCNYGVPRSKIGKIYKDGTEIFKYGSGVLSLKFQAYDELGLSKPTIIKLVTCCPNLLIGGVNKDFQLVLERLSSLAIELDWLRTCLSDKCTYNWKRVLEMLNFLDAVKFKREDLSSLISQNSRFIFDDSGKKIFILFAMLLKLGLSADKIVKLFLKYPCITVGSFTEYLWHAVQFLSEIGMETQEIAMLTFNYPHVFGACSCRKPQTVLRNLNVKEWKLCELIREDPSYFSSVAGKKNSKSVILPKVDGYFLREKTQFLLKLGFVENSDEMTMALCKFRGRGDQLQERFDFLLSIGLDCHALTEMIKQVPHILNQSKEVIESKTEFLLNNLEYPLEKIVAFPSCLCYSLEKMKLRFTMINWLHDRGVLKETKNPKIGCAKVALSTILACSDSRFVKYFVNLHPEGPQEWKRLKKTTS